MIQKMKINFFVIFEFVDLTRFSTFVFSFQIDTGNHWAAYEFMCMCSEREKVSSSEASITLVDGDDVETNALTAKPRSKHAEEGFKF